VQDDVDVQNDDDDDDDNDDNRAQRVQVGTPRGPAPVLADTAAAARLQLQIATESLLTTPVLWQDRPVRKTRLRRRASATTMAVRDVLGVKQPHRNKMQKIIIYKI